MNKLLLLSLLALLLAAPAGATTGSTGTVLSPEKGLDLSRSFEAQRDAILKALDDGETYSEIAPQDLQTVKESLARISSLLEGSEGVDRLPEATRVRVFNEQEQVNTLLGQAHADSRMICRRERATGSNRPTNTCMTVAQRRRARDAATDFLRFNPRAQGPNVDR